MRFINKKVIIGIFCLIEVTSLFLMYKSFNNKNAILDDVKLVNNEVKNKGFAVMVENEDGEYVEYDNNTWPNNKRYNKILSGCIDTRGNKIDNALTFDTANTTVTLETGSTAYCYLYFDNVDNNIYANLINDYEDGKGVYLLSETSSDIYPVYYYAGNVTNNNVIYANFCWKMVRTTDTGGVKLIYNGEVTDGSCNNTGTSSHIETTDINYNSESNSLAYVGYMYNKVYVENYKYLASDTTEYVYGNSVTWNGEKYTLVNTKSGKWSSLYDGGLDNYHYTCWNESCKSVYYINFGNSSYTYYITLNNGKKIEDAINEMLYASDVNKTNSTIKTKIDSWYESNIKGKIDTNGKLYSDYLENTIFCNNRETTFLGSFNPDGGSITSLDSVCFNYKTLYCENTRDQFTLKESAGGTLGYGNNALDYPIGLLTLQEAIIARNKSNDNYLNNNSNFWLMSPNFMYANTSGVSVVNSGGTSDSWVGATEGVRPVLSLSKNVIIKDGTGTINSPYTIELKI